MPQAYEKHVFVCTHYRESDPESSCAQKGGNEICETLKSRLKALNLQQKIRINRAGCLGHCEQGLALVVYPMGLWHLHVKPENVDEIIEKSILERPPSPHLAMTQNKG